MYSENANSRIMREFFWIYQKTQDFLTKIAEEDNVTMGQVMVFMASLMLREDGFEYFGVSDIERNTPVSLASIHRHCKWLTEKGIFEESGKKYECLVRTPNFLTNPTELYERPITIVRDKNYERKQIMRELIIEILTEMKDDIIVSQEQKESDNLHREINRG